MKKEGVEDGQVLVSGLTRGPMIAPTTISWVSLA